jgi:glutamate dehydrogenase (NAD(P)+)
MSDKNRIKEGGGGEQKLQLMSVWDKIDEWGPEKMLQVYDPDTGMKGVLVIDNTSTGPGKGGIRFADSVTPRSLGLLEL